jgi:CspA family cold shock protein
MSENRFERSLFMARGKVRWFNDMRGYGFIEKEDGGSLFVHFTSIRSDGFRTLSEGQPVEFEVVKSDRGLEARNVISLESV